MPLQFRVICALSRALRKKQQKTKKEVTKLAKKVCKMLTKTMLNRAIINVNISPGLKNSSRTNKVAWIETLAFFSSLSCKEDFFLSLSLAPCVSRLDCDNNGDNVAKKKMIQKSNKLLVCSWPRRKTCKIYWLTKCAARRYDGKWASEWMDGQPGFWITSCQMSFTSKFCFCCSFYIIVTSLCAQKCALLFASGSLVCKHLIMPW